MAQYLGFSTQNACKPKTTNAPIGSSGGPGGINDPVIPGKKFKLVDAQLVIQDFINALNIRKGTKVGQPNYGSDIWNYVFEPNTADVQFRLESEIRRVASLDNRLQLNYVKGFPKENGILIEVEVAVVPFNNPLISTIYFDRSTARAYQI